MTTKTSEKLQTIEQSVDSEQYIKQLAKDLQRIFYAVHPEFVFSRSMKRYEITEFFQNYFRIIKDCKYLYIAQLLIVPPASAWLSPLKDHTFFQCLILYSIFWASFLPVAGLISLVLSEKSQSSKKKALMQQLYQDYTKTEEEIFYLSAMYIRHHEQSTQILQESKNAKARKQILSFLDSCEKLQRAFEVIKEKLSNAQQAKRQLLNFSLQYNAELGP